MSVSSEILSLSSGVSLERYNSEFDAGLASFSLPEGQSKFTLLPSEMIRRAQGDDTRHPVVILHNGAPVGFFVLRSGEVVKDFSANPRALLLVALCVSHAHQGKGFAGKGLRLLRDFVSDHFRDSNEVVLAVNEHNAGAIHLYKKVGFEDTGERKLGKLGTTLVFSLFWGEC